MTINPPVPRAAGNSQPRRVLRAVAKGWRRRPTAAPERIRTLKLPGRVLRVAVRPGKAEWPPLLLCNGIGARLELLQPFVDALDPRREVVRFDMPGIGGSPAPVMPYHLWTLAPLLSDLLDQLGYQQADLLGISWGGGLAQQFAVRCPARVRRLVLVATAPGALMVPGHPRVLRHMLTPRRHRDPAYAAAIAGEIYGGSLRADPSRTSELLHATAGPGPGRGYYYQLLAAVGWTSLPLLPLVRQPTLILAGDDDPLTPLANARIMHRLIPRSVLTTYHGGHLDLVSEPKRMAAVVEEFLNAETGSATESADGTSALNRRWAPSSERGPVGRGRGQRGGLPGLRRKRLHDGRS